MVEAAFVIHFPIPPIYPYLPFTPGLPQITHCLPYISWITQSGTAQFSSSLLANYIITIYHLHDYFMTGFIALVIDV